MKILEKYQLEFFKHHDGQAAIKSSGNEAWISNYIYIYRNPEDIEDYISDLELAIDGDFEQVEEVDYSGFLGSYYNAEITGEGVEIWQDSWEDRSIIPLQDMRDILMRWKEFIES